jgi:hypothetical protein
MLSTDAMGGEHFVCAVGWAPRLLVTHKRADTGLWALIPAFSPKGVKSPESLVRKDFSGFLSLQGEVR